MQQYVHIVGPAVDCLLVLEYLSCLLRGLRTCSGVGVVIYGRAEHHTYYCSTVESSKYNVLVDPVLKKQNKVLQLDYCSCIFLSQFWHDFRRHHLFLRERFGLPRFLQNTSVHDDPLAGLCSPVDTTRICDIS
jgi:hypothetical protein